MRNNSFWNSNISLLDKLFFKLRILKLRKFNFNNKKIVDFWSWFDATFMRYMKSKYKDSDLTAFDIKLNKKSLEDFNINCIEWDLNSNFRFDDKLDIAICTAVLEHISEPILFLNKIYDNLNQWWCLVLTVPSKWAKPVLEFLAYDLKVINKYEIEDHKEYYDKQKLVKYLKQAWFNENNILHEYFELYMNNFVIVTK